MVKQYVSVALWDRVLSGQPPPHLGLLPAVIGPTPLSEILLPRWFAEGGTMHHRDKATLGQKPTDTYLETPRIEEN